MRAPRIPICDIWIRVAAVLAFVWMASCRNTFTGDPPVRHERSVPVAAGAPG